MTELINAIESAMRKIIQEEVVKVINDRLSEGNFDSLVESAIEHNSTIADAIGEIVSRRIDNYDFNDQILTAAKNITYEIRVY